jgi:hypothetical protein
MFHKLLSIFSGIFGHVCSPTVRLVGSDPNTVTVCFKFCRDPSVQEDAENHLSPDSKFIYWNGRGPRAKLKTVIINDWIVSWQCKVQQRRIDNVMQGEF